MSFWTTWTSPNADEIVELYAFEQWNITQARLPKGWKNNVPNNWDNDKYIDWTILGITKSKDNYMEAKIKSEIKTTAEAVGKAFGAWSGKTAYGTSINLHIDNISRTGYLTETKQFSVVISATGGGGSPVVTITQQHIVNIDRGLIKSWDIVTVP